MVVFNHCIMDALVGCVKKYLLFISDKVKLYCQHLLLWWKHTIRAVIVSLFLSDCTRCVINYAVICFCIAMSDCPVCQHRWRFWLFQIGPWSEIHSKLCCRWWPVSGSWHSSCPLYLPLTDWDTWSSIKVSCCCWCGQFFFFQSRRFAWMVWFHALQRCLCKPMVARPRCLINPSYPAT